MASSRRAQSRHLSRHQTRQLAGDGSPSPSAATPARRLGAVLVSAALLSGLTWSLARAETQGQAGAKAAAADLKAGKADEPTILKVPPVDARRVWVNDPAHFAAITQQFVIDANQGRVIGQVDGGFLPNPVVADNGSMFAQASTVYSRVARGKRTDYVEVFDPLSFDPVADIELPDSPRFLVGTYPWMTALTPDNGRLLFYRFAPSPAVGVVDLKGKKFDRLLDVPDCFHIFPTSAETFYMHCRDGTMAHVTIGASGAPKIAHSKAFHGEDEFLINHPAYSTKARRLIWPTYTGRIHQLDLSGGEPKFLQTLEALTEAERKDQWRPGGWQQVAYHRKSDQIFLLVDQRDQWRHKTASRYVVVIDAKSGKRLQKLDMGRPIDSVGVSQDDKPLLYALSSGDKTLYIHDAASGKELRSVDQLGHGPQVITTADLD